MKKNHIICGIKNIFLLITVIVGIYLLFSLKFKDSILNITFDAMNIYWIIGFIVFASILIIIYSYNKQYPNSKNSLLKYFRKFEKKDYWVIFSTLFSLHFLVSLFTDFYNAMNIGSVYAIFTSFYLIAIIFGFMGTLFLFGRLVYHFGKKMKQPRIKLSKDKKGILSFWKFVFVDSSYLAWNIKSKAPVMIKIFNVFIYSLFLILFVSIIFTINKPQEVSGNLYSLGKLKETYCRGRGGCMNFNNYLIGIEQNGEVQTFVLTEKEFEKCDWNLTTDIVIKSNPITHNAPFLNKIKSCQ